MKSEKCKKYIGGKYFGLTLDILCENCQNQSWLFVTRYYVRKIAIFYYLRYSGKQVMSLSVYRHTIHEI